MERNLGQKVMFVSMKNDRLNGCYLEKIDRGIAFVEMGEELAELAAFPNVISSFQNGMFLQMYQDGFSTHAEMGYVYREGPYGESEYLAVCHQAEAECISFALKGLDDSITKKQQSDVDMIYRKAYRTYGQVKYR